MVRLDPAEITDYWQLWQQVSHALSKPTVTLIIDDLHLLERDRSTGPLRAALREPAQPAASSLQHEVIRSLRYTKRGWLATWWSFGLTIWRLTRMRRGCS